MNELGTYLVSGISQGMTFGLVALGFVLIYRVTGILNFTQGSFVTLGGLLAAQLAVETKMPTILLAIVCMAVIGLLGLFVGAVCSTVKGDLTALILTVGLSIVFEGVGLAIFGAQPLSFSAPAGNHAIYFSRIALFPQDILVVLIGIVVVVVSQWLLGHTIWGMALRASASNRNAAKMSGITPARMALLAFVIGGILGGLTGYLITPLTSMGFGSDVTWTINGFSAAIIGGLNDPLRAVGGGMVLGIVESLVGGYVSSSYQTAGALFVMLVVLVWRPQGLFSRSEA